MVCPVCQQESGSSTVCAKCGASLGSAQATPATGDPFATKNATTADHVKSAFIGVVLVAVWTVVAFLAYARALGYSGGVRDAHSIGFFTGTLLTPVLISALIVWLMNRFREVKMSTLHKHTLVTSFALGLTLVSFVGDSHPRDADATRKQVGHLLKQAAGKEAVTENTEWYTGPTRDFFRDILKYNQEYSTAIDSVDSSSLPKLYTPESYSTKASLQSTVTQLQTLLDVDKKYESLDPIFKKLETNIAAAAPTKRDSGEFLDGFHGTAEKSLAPRNETFHTEEEWLQSSIDLYQFTLAHFSDYKVRSKKLIFSHDDIREQFHNLQSKSIALHKAAMDAKKTLDASRQKALAQSGITPEDLSTPTSQQK